MIPQRSVVGIDLGAHAVRAVEARATAEGLVVARAFAAPRAELLGEAGEGPAALARGLRAALDAARMPRRDVYLGLGGQEIMLRYLRIPPAPSWRVQMIVQYEANEIGERTGEPLARAHRSLPRGGEEVEEETVLVALAKEAQLEALLDALEAEGVTVAGVVPNAVANFSLQDVAGRKMDPDAPEEDLLLLVDIGGESIQLTFVLNDRLVFARSSSMGGRLFTEALASDLGTTPANAERLKVEKAGMDERLPGVHPQAVGAMRKAGGQLLSLLQSSVQFARTQTGQRLPALTRVELLGRGARLPGLAEFLEKSIGCPVAPFRPQSVAAGPTLDEAGAGLLEEAPGELHAALGLCAGRAPGARRGEPTVRSLSILPAKYVKRRQFKDRTLFLYAAAGILVVVLAAKLTYALIYQSSARQALAQLQGYRTELEKKKTELEGVSREVEAGRLRLNRLLKEAECTGFQAFVLDLLPRILRPEIQIEKVSWLLPVAEDNMSYVYEMRLQGRVNNERRRGLEWILELQETLKGEDRIGSVDVISSRADGAWYTFEFALKPNYVTY